MSHWLILSRRATQRNIVYKSAVDKDNRWSNYQLNFLRTLFAASAIREAQISAYRKQQDYARLQSENPICVSLCDRSVSIQASEKAASVVMRVVIVV